MGEVQKYNIFLIDPPWRIEVWDRETGLDRSPDIHYPTMTKEELFDLPVESWAADNAVMIMWTVDCHYDTAIDLGKKYGFKFNTVFQRWLKTPEDPTQGFLFPVEAPDLHIAQGYTTRSGGCEECWLFKRGDGLPVLRHDIRREFYDIRREHSRKPPIVRENIVKLYGDYPRLEMFARERTQGWDVWGNEVDKFK